MNVIKLVGVAAFFCISSWAMDDNNAKLERLEKLIKDRNTSGILILMKETNAIGGDTLLEVQNQGDKLREAHRWVAKLYDSVDQHTRHLKSIESWFVMYFVKWCGAEPETDNHQEAFHSFDQRLMREQQLRIEENTKEMERKHRATHNNGSIVDSMPYTDDPYLLKGREYIRMQDQDMDLMAEELLQMKLNASNMDISFDTQKKRMEKMNKLTERADDHMQKSNHKMDQLKGDLL